MGKPTKTELVPGLLALLLFPLVPLYGEAPPPERMESARELVELEGRSELGFETMLGSMIENLSGQLDISKEDEKEIRKIYREWWLEDVDRESMDEALAVAYAEELTTEELEKVIAFYETPAGKSLLEAMPDLMAKSTEVALRETRAKAQKLTERLQPFIERKMRKSKSSGSPSGNRGSASRGRSGAGESRDQTSDRETRSRARIAALKTDVRQLLAASQQYFLEKGVREVAVDYDPETGEIEAPLGDYLEPIGRGYTLPEKIKMDGKLRISHPELRPGYSGAEKGDPFYFDERGRLIERSGKRK